MSLNLAPGVEFNEDKHEYWYKGKQLRGVTTAIGIWHNKKFKNAPVERQIEEGSYVHKMIDIMVKGETISTNNEAVMWIAEKLHSILDKKSGKMYTEVLVSDFTSYASSIDIIHVLPNGEVDLYDMKRTMFRPTVSSQLTIYKKFAQDAGLKVSRLFCISYTDKIIYPVVAVSDSQIKAILYPGGAN